MKVEGVLNKGLFTEPNKYSENFDYTRDNVYPKSGFVEKNRFLFRDI